MSDKRKLQEESDHIAVETASLDTQVGTAPTAGQPLTGQTSLNYWQLVWRQFKKNRLAVIGLAMVLVFFIMAAFAPLLTNKYPYFWYDPQNGGLSFPLFAALTSIDLGLLLAFLLAVMLPVTRRLLDRTGRRFSSSHPLRRALLVSAVVLLVGMGLLMLRTDRPRIMTDVDLGGGLTGRMERNFKAEYAERGDEITALFPPSSYAPSDIFTGERFEEPSLQHPLGTDSIGRSNLARIIYGSRLALFVGFISVSISAAIGLFIGGVSGYFGGWVDLILQRVVEIFIAFPTFFLLLTIIAFWGPRLPVIMVAIGLTNWTGIARLIRANVLQVRTLDYITAARALGARTMPIIFKHALPNSIAPVLVSISFGIAGAIFLEVTLSFLGLSNPDYPSWGLLLEQTRSVAIDKPALLVIPGVTIFLAVLAYNLMGEGLRDALDPRMKS